MPFRLFSRANKKVPNYYLYYQELMNSFAMVMDKEMILSVTSTKIKEILPKHQVHYLEKREEYYQQVDGDIRLPINSRLVGWLTQNRACLTLQGSIRDYIRMDVLNLEVLNPRYIYPLLMHNNIILIAIISGNELNEVMSNFIQSIFQVSVIAYHNADRRDRELKQMDSDYQQRKMAIVGRMASSMAHEIRNPLTSIRSSIQLIETSIEQPELKQIANNLISEVDRINTITEDLLGFAKPRQLNTSLLDLCSVVDSVLSLYSQKLKEAVINVSTNYTPLSLTKILADEDALKQVLINFLNNSIEAMEQTETKDLTIEIQLHSPDKLIFIWTDTGVGMSNETIEHITEPFFTTKSGGTGLGMAIVKQLLEQHGFELQIMSLKGKGTSINVHIPVEMTPNKW